MTVLSRWIGVRKNPPKENLPSGRENLQGDHFRVGWTFYPGINPTMYAMHNKTSMGDSCVSDGYLRMIPPLIPRPNASLRGIYQGISVSAQYYHDRTRLPIPNTTRR